MTQIDLALWNQGLCMNCGKPLSEWEKHFGLCQECAIKKNREGLERKETKPKWHRSLD